MFYTRFRKPVLLQTTGGSNLSGKMSGRLFGHQFMICAFSIRDLLIA